MQNGAKFPGIPAGIFLKTYSREFVNGNFPSFSSQEYQRPPGYFWDHTTKTIHTHNGVRIDQLSHRQGMQRHEFGRHITYKLFTHPHYFVPSQSIAHPLIGINMAPHSDCK